MAKLVAECTHAECSWGPVERDANADNSPEKRLRSKGDRHERMTEESGVWDEPHKVKIEIVV